MSRLVLFAAAAWFALTAFGIYMTVAVATSDLSWFFVVGPAFGVAALLIGGAVGATELRKQRNRDS